VKRILLIILLIPILFLFACTSQAPQPKTKPPLVMATTYPVEVLTRSVVEGTDLHVERLITAQGACAHEVMLGTQERLRLSKAGVLVINGGGMEPFVKDLQKAEPSLAIISCGPVQAAPCSHDCQHEHEAEQHAFAALLSAAVCLERIAAGLSEQYPAQHKRLDHQSRLMRELCITNALRLQGRAGMWQKRNVVLDHSLLEPLAQEWNLKVLAIIDPSGTGAGQSAARMAELLHLMKGADAVLSSGSNLASVLAKEAGKPLVLLEVLNQGPVGATVAHLISSMERNADRLERVLAAP
jgi:ABC-type Zn uptake system ZnuABC Zn-binding protein ZnuA